MKMPFGTEVGLGPGHIVLDRDPAPPAKRPIPDPYVVGRGLARTQPPPRPFGPLCFHPENKSYSNVLEHINEVVINDPTILPNTQAPSQGIQGGPWTSNFYTGFLTP